MIASKKKDKGVPNIINIFSKFILDLTKNTPSAKKKLSLEDITKISSKAVDETILEIEKREGAKFGSGRFYITELNGMAFKTSMLMYFVKPNEPYFEVKREGAVFTISRLNAEAINTLKDRHEVAFKITPP